MRSGVKVLFLSFLLISTAGYAGAADASLAKILHFEGDVQVKTGPAAGWIKAEKDQILSEGGEVLTGPQSECEVAVGEGLQSAIRLNAESRAILKSLNPVRIDLQSGKIYALVRGLKKGSDFQVSSPTAIAAARGTGFSEDMNSIEDFEDNVYVHGQGGGDKTLDEGQGTEVEEDGSLGDTYKLPDEAMDQWNDFKDDAQDHMGNEAGTGDDGGEGGVGEGTGGTGGEEMGPGTDVSDNIDDLSDAHEESNESEDQEEIDKMTKGGDTTKDHDYYEAGTDTGNY